MKLLKKAGWFIVSMLPVMLSFILQFGCAFLVMFFFIFSEMARQQGNLSASDLLALVSNKYLENAIYAVTLYHVAGLLVFGIWYYLAYGKKKRFPGIEKPDVKKIAVIALLGAAVQLFTSGVLNLIYIINPDLLQNFMELMELAGITEFTLISFITTVILAPMGEELLCRGITLRIARKVSNRFWIANIIQALAFGILHGNLVQGTYAFFMGLILGYIYEKYHNIWICMFLHGIINFTSLFIDYYIELFPANYIMPALVGSTIIGLLLMIFCFKVLGNLKPIQENLTDENAAN